MAGWALLLMSFLAPVLKMRGLEFATARPQKCRRDCLLYALSPRRLSEEPPLHPDGFSSAWGCLEICALEGKVLGVFLFAREQVLAGSYPKRCQCSGNSPGSGA